MLPLETLPPGEPSGGVVYLRIVLSPEEASCLQVFLNINVLQGGVVSNSPKPKLEDHPLSAVHDCLFNLFAATIHKGGRSSIRNLRTRHAEVTVTHYTLQKGVLHVQNWVCTPVSPQEGMCDLAYIGWCIQGDPLRVMQNRELK